MSAPPTPRTTPALVQGIIDVQSGFDLTPMIAVANQLTTDNCTYPHYEKAWQKPYTDGFVGSKMELIERWLSAHFYTIYDNQLTFARAGSAGVGFLNQVDLGLKNSMFGQQAIRLDNYGGLAELDNTLSKKRKIKVKIMWMGRRLRFFCDEADNLCPDADVSTGQ